MSKAKWIEYERGDGEKLKKMRGLIWIHVFFHTHQKDKPKHPYQIRINDKSIGHSTNMEAGKKFGEKKFSELLQEEL